MKVIYIDDSVEDRELLLRDFRPPEYEVFTAASIDEAIDRLEPNGHEAIITDLGMPGYSGTDAVRRLHERYAVPIIALTGAIPEAVIRELFAAGAFDVVFKTGDYAKVLKRSLRAAQLDLQVRLKDAELQGAESLEERLRELNARYRQGSEG